MKRGSKVTVAKLVEKLIIELGDPDRAVSAEELREAKETGKLIADILARNWGIRKVRYLGLGDFGIAGILDDERVLKITTDRMEAALGLRLLGHDLRYVANVDEVVSLKGIQIYNWNVREVLDVYALIVERIPGDVLQGRSEAKFMRDLISEIAHVYNVDHTDVERLPAEEAEERFKGASLHLVQVLEGRPAPLGEIALALKELQALGLYTVDVNPENVAWDERREIWRVFDLGIPFREDVRVPEISGLR